MRRTWGMFYSGECPQNSREFRQTFRGMSWKIPGNVLKYSRQCRWTFREMLPNINIAGNVVKNSGDCSQRFRGMSLNIPENVAKHFGECREKFRGMSLNIKGNVTKHSGDCCETVQGRSSKNPEKICKWSEICCKTFCGKYENFWMNVYNSTRYWWSWTLPIYWRAVAVKVYFSPAGLNVALGNWTGLFIEQIENVS